MAGARRLGLFVAALAACALTACWWGPVKVSKPLASSETRLSGKDRIVQRTYTDGTVTYGIVGQKEEFVSHAGSGYDYGAVLESAFYASKARVGDAATTSHAPAMAAPTAGAVTAQPPVELRPPAGAYGHGGQHPQPTPPTGYRPP
jgi:hypothetical protein